MVAEINDNVERIMDYKKMSDRITDCLISLGFSLNCDGFDLIKDATIMIISSNNKNIQMTKTLYPEVGKMYNKNSAQVERNIRYAIEKAFNYNGEGIAHNLMGNAYNPNKGKPTNSEFLMTFERVIENRFGGEF